MPQAMIAIEQTGSPIRRGRNLADLDFRVVDVLDHLTKVAHVEPLTAAGAFHEMIGIVFGDAINIAASHDFAFGFRPSSAHLRATSSMLSARHRN